MGELLDGLSSFFGSEFAKDNIAVIIALIFISIVITAVIVSFIFNKLVIPFKLYSSDYIKPDYENALAEIKELREENNKLKKEINKYKNIKMIEMAIAPVDSENQRDKALETFLKGK